MRHAVLVRGDQRLWIEECGEGPPLVLVHGLPGRACDFAPLMSALAPQVHSISYDRAGYASSAPNTRPAEAGLKQSADDLLALLDALELERAALLGWSYGGPIVLEAATRAPARVSRLILVGAAGPSFTWRGWTHRLLYRTPLGGPIVRALLGLGRWTFRRPLEVALGTPASAAQLESFVDGITRPGAVDHWLREGRRWNARSTRTSVDFPALVIHGTRDAQVPLEVGEALAAALPNAALHRIPDAGHWPFATHTDRVAELVLHFLGNAISTRTRANDEISPTRRGTAHA